MKYLRLFEEFVETTKRQTIQKDELSDKTIDDVLKDDFLDEEDELVTKDDREVYQIKNWLVY